MASTEPSESGINFLSQTEFSVPKSAFVAVAFSIYVPSFAERCIVPVDAVIYPFAVSVSAEIPLPNNFSVPIAMRLPAVSNTASF